MVMLLLPFVALLPLCIAARKCRTYDDEDEDDEKEEFPDVVKATLVGNGTGLVGVPRSGVVRAPLL